MAWVSIADEYHADGSLTDYLEYAKQTPAIFQKADEGLGSSPNSDWYPGASKKARDAGLKCGAYFWILIAHDGAAQADRFLKTAPSADFYAVDLEAGDGNAPHSKPEIISCFQAFSDEFHARKPEKPLILYGASFMWSKGITWNELVGDRDWMLAWVPRYDFRPNDIRQWPVEAVMDYAWLDRYKVPMGKLALVQYTDGRLGPAPRTLPGLNRMEDLSVMVMPLEALTGESSSVSPPETGPAVPAGPEDSYVIRKPDGGFSKAIDLDQVVTSVRNLLTEADPGASVGIRKRQRA